MSIKNSFKNSFEQGKSQWNIQELNRRNKEIQEISNSFTVIKKDFDRIVVGKVNNSFQNDQDVREAHDKYNDMKEEDAVVDFKSQIKSQDEGLEMLHNSSQNL